MPKHCIGQLDLQIVFDLVSVRDQAVVARGATGVK